MKHIFFSLPIFYEVYVFRLQPKPLVLATDFRKYLKKIRDFERVFLRFFLFESIILNFDGNRFIFFSSKGIDIVDFDKHVLKKDVPQTITGNWTFHNVEVRGKI